MKPNENYDNYTLLAAHVPIIYDLTIPLVGGLKRIELEVSVDGEDYRFLVTSRDSKYFIDLMAAFKAIMLDGLSDAMPDTYDAYIDPALGKEVVVSWYRVYEDSEEVYDTDTWLVVNAVRKLGQTSVMVDRDPFGEDRKALLPDVVDGYRYKMFSGYPFDVAIVVKGGGDGNVTISDGANTATYAVDAFGSGDVVLRLPIDPDGDLDLYPGRKDWVIAFPGEDDESAVAVEVVDKCGGVYLKWLNSTGSWSYWLFSRRKEIEESGKTTEDYEVYVGDPVGANARRSVLSKETSFALTIGDKVHRDDLLFIREVFTSPKVFVYEDAELPVGVNKWTEVIIEKHKAVILDTRRTIYEVEIEIGLPAPYLNTM